MMFMGNNEYPRVDTLWKNEIFPSNKVALIVTTTAPNHTSVKTVPKIELESALSLEFIVRVNDNAIHNSKGPHKSQFFK